MLILLAFVILGVLLPGLYFYLLLFQKDSSFSASAATTFNLKNCEIIWIRDNNYAASDPFFEI